MTQKDKSCPTGYSADCTLAAYQVCAYLQDVAICSRGALRSVLMFLLPPLVDPKGESIATLRLLSPRTSHSDFHSCLSLLSPTAYVSRFSGSSLWSFLYRM